MKQILLITFLLFLLSDIYGQRTCGSELNLQFIKQNDPERYQRIMLMEQHVTNYKNQRNLESTSHHAVITIPVVVHVLHTGQAVGTGLNISLAQIQSQINVLNEDFRRLNADASNTPSDFQSVASDSEFEFVLACVDPNGNPTNGIVRVQTSVTTFQQNLDDVKYDTSGGSNAWPADRYLNIWVAERVEFLGQEILGYAQFPDMMATQPDTDGVVIRTSAFGRTGNVVAPWHKGRTATHEVGHWLNLRHIWGDSICGDDFVADTPTQSTSSSDCPNHPRTSCGSMDMFMNYMDYTDDACMNIFTNGQATRMQALFEPGGVRESFVDCNFIAQVCTTPPTITGPSQLCTSNRTFTINNRPPGTDVNWTVSNNAFFTIDSDFDNNNTFTTAATSFAIGSEQVIATLTGDCEEVTVITYNVIMGSRAPVASPSFANMQTGTTYPFYADFIDGFTGSSNGLDYQWIVTPPGGLLVILV